MHICVLYPPLYVLVFFHLCLLEIKLCQNSSQIFLIQACPTLESEAFRVSASLFTVFWPSPSLHADFPCFLLS